LTYHPAVANIVLMTEMSVKQSDRLILFPPGTSVNGAGHLVIGECDACDLARQFGTPLYIFDESTLRANAIGFKNEFGKRYSQTTVLYACKAFLNYALLMLFKEEGIGLDVVSGGEIRIAHKFGFPMNTVSFPGNNKSKDELLLALECGISRIVVDNFDEVVTLGELAKSTKHHANVLIRVSPGIDPHTHRYETTGSIDSKFGFPLVLAEKALLDATATPQINVKGLHFHIGSQLISTEPYREAIEIILKFASRMHREHGFRLQELSVGGGYPVQETLDLPVPPLSAFAETITSSIIDGCKQYSMELPRLVIEPGRLMVAQAGIALYTVGTRKEIPGVRTYISVDGGMGDNIRPALYQSRMEAVLANRMNESVGHKYTISGKFCESGDVLIQDIEMPEMSSGDILAVPVCGAYNIPQSCNYNAFIKPAVIMVKDGRARLIRRRETIDDLVRCDVV
jgi:diaminopimelate decarboxylase